VSAPQKNTCIFLGFLTLIVTYYSLINIIFFKYNNLIVQVIKKHTLYRMQSQMQENQNSQIPMEGSILFTIIKHFFDFCVIIVLKVI